jgi:hypothetical protein
MRPRPARATAAGDLLRINFNISFPHLACQYASVDLSDVLGMVRSAPLLRSAACCRLPCSTRFLRHRV